MICRRRGRMTSDAWEKKGLNNPSFLVTVVVRLVRTFGRDTEIIRLDIRKSSKLNTELFQVEAGNFFIQLLGKNVNANGPLFGFSPEGDLSQNLVTERVGHDERGVASGTTQVDETTFSQKNDVLTALHGETINLRLDVNNGGSVGLQPGNIDFNVKVTNVTDNGIILHGFKVTTDDDITTTGGGDEDVSFVDSFFHGSNFITFHGGLESVNRINFGDDDTRTEGTEGSSTTLTDITVTGDNGNLTGNHDIGGTLDTVDEGFTATVQVVKLGLGNGVIDVDGGEHELTVLEHLVQVVDTSSGFFRETLDTRDQVRVLFVDNVGQVTTVIQDHVQRLTVREEKSLLNTPDKFYILLSYTHFFFSVSIDLPSSVSPFQA